jgi:3',5'-cyclic AMP phosphodiesterase CpdA
MRSDTHLTRRQLLRRSAGSLLTAGLWPGALWAADGPATEEFHFLVVNDVHCLDRRCHPFLERVIKQMKAHKEPIDFCLLAGDLSEHGKAEQLEPVRDIFKGLGKPVHVVIGNHDYLTPDDRKPYEKAFPRSINYRFEHRGWQFLGLDSSEGQKAQAAVQPATLRWLDDTLPKLDRKKPLVVFTHFPWGPLVIHRSTNAEDILKRFKECNLQAVFSGHFHASTERRVGAVTFTTNRCCSFSRANHDGSKEKGYFLCRVREGKIERSFVEVKPA